MFLTLTILLTMAVVTAAIFARIIFAKKREKIDAKQGLVLLEHIQKLVLSCQKHRGLSNAVLQGNVELRQALLAEQTKIELLIRQGNNDLSCDVFAQWNSFADHWPRLKNHALKRDLPSQNLIRQHNVMIEGHLSLMDEIIRYYSLHNIMLDSVTRLAGLCLDTLRVAETVGQTRAIGSGVCARGVCKGVDKISLNFLRISLKASTDHLFSELNNINNEDLHNPVTSASINVKTSIERLIKTLDEAVLVDGNTTIDSKEYFNLATTPIEQLFSVNSLLLSYGQKTA